MYSHTHYMSVSQLAAASAAIPQYCIHVQLHACAHTLSPACACLLEATLHAHRSCTPSVRYVSVADHPVCVPAPPGETEGESQSCVVCGGLAVTVAVRNDEIDLRPVRGIDSCMVVVRWRENSSSSRCHRQTLIAIKHPRLATGRALVHGASAQRATFTKRLPTPFPQRWIL